MLHYICITKINLFYIFLVKKDFSPIGIYASNNDMLKYINTDSLYLDKYSLTTDKVLTASVSNKSYS